MGLVKAITLGMFGILLIMDIVNAKKKTLEYNSLKVLDIINPDGYVRTRSEKDEAKLMLGLSKEPGKTVAKGAKDISRTFYLDD